MPENGYNPIVYDDCPTGGTAWRGGFFMVLTKIPASVEIDWSLLWTRFGWLDVVFLVLLGFGIFYGMRKGLTKVLPGLISILAAQTLTVESYKTFSAFAQKIAPLTPEIWDPTFFALLAIGTLISFLLGFKLLEAIATLDFKSPFNNVGGALAGALQLILLLGFICSFLNFILVPFIQEEFQNRSLSGPYLVTSSDQVHQVIMSIVPENWRIKK